MENDEEEDADFRGPAAVPFRLDGPRPEDEGDSIYEGNIDPTNLEGLLPLRTGSAIRRQPLFATKSGWTPGWNMNGESLAIIHRDIKYDNVFFDQPDIEFPSYPRSRLGDFGFAIMTDDVDPYNPLAYNDSAQADLWRAPEQHLYVSPETHIPVNMRKLNEKTNIWQVGAVMVRLMNRTAKLNREQGDYRTRDTNELRVNLAERWNPYSDVICDLVDQCTKSNQDERPSLRELRETIRQHTSSDIPDDLAKSLRSNTISSDEEQSWGLKHFESSSKLNMAHPNAPNPSGEDNERLSVDNSRADDIEERSPERPDPQSHDLNAFVSGGTNEEDDDDGSDPDRRDSEEE